MPAFRNSKAAERTLSTTSRRAPRGSDEALVAPHSRCCGRGRQCNDSRPSQRPSGRRAGAPWAAPPSPGHSDDPGPRVAPAGAPGETSLGGARTRRASLAATRAGATGDPALVPGWPGRGPRRQWSSEREPPARAGVGPSLLAGMGGRARESEGERGRRDAGPGLRSGRLCRPPSNQERRAARDSRRPTASVRGRRRSTPQGRASAAGEELRCPESGPPWR